MEELSSSQIEAMPLGEAVLTDVVGALENVGGAAEIVVDNMVEAVSLENVGQVLEVVGGAADVTVNRTVVITKWGATWLGKAWNLWRAGGPSGLYASKILAVMDSVDEEPEEFIETHTKEEIKTVVQTKRHKETKAFIEDVVVQEKRVKIVKKLKKGQRSNFAAAVAKLAYNKFGERPQSEANVLVTRKWLQKYFDDAKFTDLRTVDKNNAIDRALFLSFVPTKDFQRARIAVATRQWQARMDASSSFAGFWTTVFGVGSVDSASDELC